MTTVGYGNLFPKSDTRRVLAIFVMLIGIGFLVLVTGSVAERFLRGNVTDKAESASAEPGNEVEQDTVAELRKIRAQLDRLEARLVGEK